MFRLIRAILGLALLFALGWATWAGVTWLRYGHAGPGDRPDPAIEPFIPRFEVAERHERIVEAAPSVTFRAVQAFRFEDSPVVRAIFLGREIILSQNAAEPAPALPMLQMARAIGWGLLDSVPDRELVFGAVTQPWLGDVRFRALPPDQFAAFDSAGYAKIVWSIAVDSLGPGVSRVRTETRVATTDPSSRALFRRYWAIFSPGIVLIRREALRTVANEAKQLTPRPLDGPAQ